MPKKLNFLGGQQNYNPNTSEYEPALKGPNGESPKAFSSFKKEKDESFDAINEERMYGKKTSGFNTAKETFEWNYNAAKKIKPEVLKARMGELIEQFGEDSAAVKGIKKALEEMGEGAEEQPFGMQAKIDAEMKSTFEDARKQDAEIENKLKKFAEKGGIDYNEIKNEYINRLDKAIKEQGFGMKDATEVALDGLEDDIVMGWKPSKAEEGNSFEEVNAKRIGKETPKAEETPLQKWHSTQDYRDKHNELAQKLNKGEITEQQMFDGLKKLDSDFENNQNGNGSVQKEPAKRKVQTVEKGVKKITEGNKVTWKYGEGNPYYAPGFQKSIEPTENGWLLKHEGDVYEIERLPGGKYKQTATFYTRDDGGRKKRIGSREETFSSFEKLMEEVDDDYAEVMKQTKDGLDTKYSIDDEGAQKLMREGSSRALTEDEKKQLKEYYANQMKKYGL